ncbi:anti-CBASS protein Acb1 family protein [Yersinia aldovae]|uniref:Phage-associated protein n=1 Tax=Yersinia aldovae TaxID=29483 RepID=A0ABM9STZ9_YERAL|nr:anti-CBASS Acb1 family protein [Yersinia aldovae]CNL14537.1 phage-associated protein [Yersinia aldovae]
MSETLDFGGKPRIRLTADGLSNVMTGMGTDRDRRMYSRFMYGAMQDFAELEAAYTENWIARSIIDIPVDDATREWRSFPSDDATALRNAENQFNIQGVIMTNRGSATRAGKSGVSDEQFIFEFADSEET